jgi:hypothetical protein
MVGKTEGRKSRDTFPLRTCTRPSRRYELLQNRPTELGQ